MLQSESLTYSSEVTFTDGLISEILATPITSEYTPLFQNEIVLERFLKINLLLQGIQTFFI
ncbi:MAG: hypothetical protein ACLTZB_05245 [Streptococcus salivarius]